MTPFPHRYSPPLVLLLGLFAAVRPIQAQTSPSASGDQVVPLAEFDVSAQAEHGYVANESTTGTRIASKIGDLPLSVNVVTRDFLEDFDLLGLGQELSFVSGFSPSDGGTTGPSQETQFQIRGFQTSTTLVDGFRRIGLVDEVAIDRIEVIKGTAADIYGAIAPGGTVNIITRRPTDTPTQELEVSYGEFASGGLWSGSANNEHLNREDFSSSGPLGTSGRLSYRVDLAYEYLPDGSQYAQNQETYGDIQLLYRPSDRTSLRLVVEAVDNYTHPPGSIPLLETTGYYKYQPAKLANLILGSAFPDYGIDGLPAGFNAKGPQEYRHNRQQSATATLEHSFSDVWTLRASANGFADRAHALYANDVYFPLGVAGVGTGTQPLVQLAPQWIINPQHGGGYQVDSVVKLDWSKVQNKFLLTNDYYQLDKTVWQYTGAQSDYNPFDPGAIVPPETYSGLNIPTPETNPATFAATANNNNWTKFQDYGLFASDTLSFFQKRLFALAEVRYDFVWNEVRNYIYIPPGAKTSVRQDTSYADHDWTRGFGLLGKVTDSVSVFVNDSTAFNPQPQLDQNGNPLADNTSTGVEFGVKMALASGKLNFTVDHFEINEFNLAQSSKDANNNTVVLLTGEQSAKGYEADVNWQPTPALEFVGGYGYTVARIVNAYSLPFLIGTPTPQAPRDNLGVAARYSVVSGPFKGLYFTANERYYSKSLISVATGTPLTASAAAPLVNLPYPNGFLPFPNLPVGAIVTSGTQNFDNGRFDNFNAPYALLGVGVGYGFRTGKFTQTVMLDASNILNRYYSYGQGAPGNPCQIVARYRISF